MNTPKPTVGCSIPMLPIFTVFLILKLAGAVTWSWWLVTAPLWFVPALFLGLALVVGSLGLLLAILEK